MTHAQPNLKLPAGSSLAALVPELPGQPFWQMVPAPAAADYADGLEDVIADFNRQPPEGLAAWAREHPLTSDQRFVLEYNTSADRANVLRPLPLAPDDRVLEVGCGCGPVSQYLWSRAHTVSLDASVARARAAAQRLARQPNPHGSVLVCADFHQLTGDASFDWVIFNGVLEYAAIYSGAAEASPYVAMLQKAATFLRPGGRCVITIENRLGLKYFAGAPEDHYGRSAVGLEGYPTHDKTRPPIRTFSKSELTGLCREAGFVTPEFLFPFPDYKFAKVVVPDDLACWKFATERMIEASPAWRGNRAYYFDEPAVFRSLVSEGRAGDFSHSFLVIASRLESGTGPVGGRQLLYYPLHRESAEAVGAVLDLDAREVRRRKLAGGPLVVAALPACAPANPHAVVVAPTAGADPSVLTQPLSSVPTLWEELRQLIAASTLPPEDHQARLETAMRRQLDRHLAGLPFTDRGSWDEFINKLREIFGQAGLMDAAAESLSFLQGQGEFAAASLAALKVQSWCWWAPDWIIENLFPLPDGSTQLFDVEYVDPAACMPSPALVYRQLRMLQTHTSHPALSAHWPWPARCLAVDNGAVRLPQPASDWAATALWGDLSGDEVGRHAWFWTKVAEVVEAAMTASAVSGFHRAYDTGPWLEKLSAELGRRGGRPLRLERVEQTEAVTPAAPAVTENDELVRKEQRILQLTADAAALRGMIEEKERTLHTQDKEIKTLHSAARERLDAVLKLDREVKRLGATLQAIQPTAEPWREARPAEDENVDLHARLAETRLRLQSTQDQLLRKEREIQLLKPRASGRARTGFLNRQLHRWQANLAQTAAHPLARLVQHAPRPLRPEKFPRPPRLSEWPRICVVTPSYQQASFLPRTMQSVLDQDYPNLAYGVQDGGSTDGSAGIITSQLARLAHAESAPDKGQSDAIRRGFSKLFPASHDLMGWVNSDDMLMPGALAFVGAYFARHPEVDVVYGHRVIIDEQDREVGRWFLPRYHANTLKWFDLVPQETLFWRARCYKEIGGLDESFQFALDWDLLARFEQACFTIHRVPYFLGSFRVHPEQKTSAKILSVGEQEMDRIRRRIHERPVSSAEIQHQLTAEIQRSAVVERLYRLGIRY